MQSELHLAAAVSHYFASIDARRLGLYEGFLTQGELTAAQGMQCRLPWEIDRNGRPGQSPICN